MPGSLQSESDEAALEHKIDKQTWLGREAFFEALSCPLELPINPGTLTRVAMLSSIVATYQW
jgi:hypothetical protein